ncbi:small, acid-soluble spore protein L [Lederbergia wuyishanensis]|uniref:Small, acid-soluble spore protein L n=1 Tax=Lederbergia wuyishanensis TaxID=1347903 RepID=A0ABU0D7M7_9BACI|nr:small, acid-soluble spore protein L [Lederbergia wuyishanensis]MCJ8009019.1 small, acid-soluble spore protein L [Lederbergia wuyishanensis]MDQ0344351.1 small acid-soluble spore protein L (minor) [Lederbergia wuyishanensis]
MSKTKLNRNAKDGDNTRGKQANSVNPQGYGQDTEFAQEPKTKLENAAKKKNTK